MENTKKVRAEQASKFLAAVAGCGRKFFAHGERISRFEVDARGRVWFVDSYSEARIYTQCTSGKWRGFTNGGTLRALVQKLSDYIRTGEQQALGLGPWPEWVCGGDLWGYGEAMTQVRASALEHGLAPSNAI